MISIINLFFKPLKNNKCDVLNYFYNYILYDKKTLLIEYLHSKLYDNNILIDKIIDSIYYFIIEFIKINNNKIYIKFSINNYYNFLVKFNNKIQHINNIFVTNKINLNYCFLLRCNFYLYKYFLINKNVFYINYFINNFFLSNNSIKLFELINKLYKNSSLYETIITRLVDDIQNTLINKNYGNDFIKMINNILLLNDTLSLIKNNYKFLINLNFYYENSYSNYVLHNIINCSFDNLKSVCFNTIFFEIIRCTILPNNINKHKLLDNILIKYNNSIDISNINEVYLLFCIYHTNENNTQAIESFIDLINKNKHFLDSIINFIINNIDKEIFYTLANKLLLLIINVEYVENSFLLYLKSLCLEFFYDNKSLNIDCQTMFEKIFLENILISKTYLSRATAVSNDLNNSINLRNKNKNICIFMCSHAWDITFKSINNIEFINESTIGALIDEYTNLCLFNSSFSGVFDYGISNNTIIDENFSNHDINNNIIKKDMSNKKLLWDLLAGFIEFEYNNIIIKCYPIQFIILEIVRDCNYTVTNIIDKLTSIYNNEIANKLIKSLLESKLLIYKNGYFHINSNNTFEDNLIIIYNNNNNNNNNNDFYIEDSIEYINNIIKANINNILKKSSLNYENLFQQLKLNKKVSIILNKQLYDNVLNIMLNNDYIELKDCLYYKII